MPERHPPHTLKKQTLVGDTSRRQALAALATLGTATFFDPSPFLTALAAEVLCPDAPPAGELLGTLPLFRDRSQAQPFGEKISGSGLDARLITDLSKLEPGKLITPNELAYIRTEIPADAANHQGPWTIKAGGLVEKPVVLDLAELSGRSRAMGPHLFECSGNANASNFGLMSVAEWEGIPLIEVVSRLKPTAAATGVRVSGFDHTGQVSRSVAGASWVYPLATLEKLGAFLAVKMNGEPIPADHGKPVRMAVPGWYGCTWIKWVNEIELVGPEELATSQMVEFAARTHQTEAHKLARDYAPAEIQTAATPIRVEKRKTSAGLEYRIVGIVWGGAKPVERLSIRFGRDAGWSPFLVCPAPKTHTMWSLWEFRWKPTAPGTYDIALKATDSSVPQRRLDNNHYLRQVKIEEV